MCTRVRAHALFVLCCPNSVALSHGLIRFTNCSSLQHRCSRCSWAHTICSIAATRVCARTDSVVCYKVIVPPALLPPSSRNPFLLATHTRTYASTHHAHAHRTPHTIHTSTTTLARSQVQMKQVLQRRAIMVAQRMRTRTTTKKEAPGIEEKGEKEEARR